MSNDSSKKVIYTTPKAWGIGAILFAGASFVLCQMFASSLFAALFGDALAVAGHFYMYAIASLLSLGVLALILRRYGARLRDLGLARFDWKYVGMAILGWPVYMVLGYLWTAVALLVVPGFDPSQSQDLGFPEITHVSELAFIFVALVIIPPFVEELLFRGFIFKGLLKHFSPVAAALATSVLFGVAHGQWNVGVDTFSLSLVLCFLAYKTQSLWPAIALHMLKNLIAFTFVFLITPGQLKDFLLRLGQ